MPERDQRLIAFFFDVSLNATTWAGRIGLLIVPPIAYWVAYRWCIGLQRSDRAVLEHGIETGIVRRLPHGEFIEIHQPLGGVDHHGHAIPLEYQGAPVPKRMNQLGSAGAPVAGSLIKPDPASETAALERARRELSEAEASRGDGNREAEEPREVGPPRAAGRPSDLEDSTPHCTTRAPPDDPAGPSSFGGCRPAGGGGIPPSGL